MKKHLLTKFIQNHRPIGMWVKGGMILLGVLLLVSCGKELSLEADVDTGEKSVEVPHLTRVTFDVQISFNQSTIGQARTRTGASDYISRLALKVFNTSGESVLSVQQLKTDTDFGTPTLSLPAGSYTLVVLGHRASSSTIATGVIQSATSIEMQEGKCYDTYCAVQELTVIEGEAQNVAVTLNVATSQIFLNPTDTPPSKLANMEIVFNESGTEQEKLLLNPTTRFTTSSYKQVLSGAVQTLADIQKYKYNYFLTENEVNVPVTLRFSDANKVVFSEKSLTVPMKLGYYTTITGPLFNNLQSVGTSFTFGTWQDNGTVTP